MDSYTKLLCNFQGMEKTSRYVAESGETVSFLNQGGGYPALLSSERFNGVSSVRLDRSHSQYLTVPTNSKFTLGQSDFTLEVNVKYNAVTGNQVFLYKYGASNDRWRLIKNDENSSPAHNISFYYVNSAGLEAYYSMTNAWSVEAGRWYNIEFSRNGTGALLFINGVSEPLTENIAFGTKNLTNNSGDLSIGRKSAADEQYLDGWLGNNYRLSIGICRHTGDFYPETAIYS